MGRPTILLLILALAASACAGEIAEEDTTTTTTTSATEQTTSTSTSTTTTMTLTTTTTTEQPIQWDFSPSASPPVITLIDPGGEPREVRAYAMMEGTVAETSMRFRFSIVQLIDGIPSIDATTAVDIQIVAEVTDVVPEGFVITSTFGNYRASASDPATEAALNSVYSELSGTGITQLVSPTGQILAVAVDEWLVDFSEITTAIAGAGAPLPTEPIGIGAEWRVDTEIDVQGIALVQTSTITLLDIDGSLLLVVLETTQELGPEGLTIPGLDLTDADASLSTVGTGTATWDLSLPIPVSGTTEAVQTMFVALSIAGEESTLNQTITSSFELPSPAAFAPPEGTQVFDIEERTHLEGSIEYDQDPPVGGIHNSVWQNCGFYGVPIDTEKAVHSFEHGAVWITYRPDLPADQVDELRERARQPFTLVSPYPGLDSPVVASAWGVQLVLESAFDPRLAEFIDWFAQGPQTPEPRAPCSGGGGDPG